MPGEMFRTPNEAIKLNTDLSKYFNQETLAELVAVMDFGEITHPNNEWKMLDTKDHIHHAKGHIDISRRWIGDRKFHFDRIDTDTKRLHLAHAACRIFMALQLELQKRKR